MALELVAEGGLDSFRQGLTSGVDRAFQPGDRGEFHLELRFIPPGFVDGLEAALRAAGVKLTGPVHTRPGRIVVIPFERNPGPIAIAIAAAAVFGGIILTLLVAWRVWKDVRDDPLFNFALVAVLVAVLGNTFSKSKRRRKG
ncbi:MAG: hypothetical protein GWN58_28550 [Anaerolineae bacterium]|nr:hypothetical protein [Anaerolineae bacterium]